MILALHYLKLSKTIWGVLFWPPCIYLYRRDLYHKLSKYIIKIWAVSFVYDYVDLISTAGQYKLADCFSSVVYEPFSQIIDKFQFNSVRKPPPGYPKMSEWGSQSVSPAVDPNKPPELPPRNEGMSFQTYILILF